MQAKDSMGPSRLEKHRRGRLDHKGMFSGENTCMGKHKSLGELIVMERQG